MNLNIDQMTIDELKEEVINLRHQNNVLLAAGHEIIDSSIEIIKKTEIGDDVQQKELFGRLSRAISRSIELGVFKYDKDR